MSTLFTTLRASICLIYECALLYAVTYPRGRIPSGQHSEHAIYPVVVIDSIGNTLFTQW